MVEELDRLARYDGLTGLLNRRALMEALETEFVRLSRYGGELSLVLLDIDHFKQINDRFGHPVGDEVLRGVGELLQRQLRTVDLAGRYGGEEFLLVLPHTGLAGAHVLATTLRARLAELKVTPLGAPVTASFGVAPIEPAYGIQAAIAAADQALYEAKAGGRDQVRLAVPVSSPATDEGG
jgi:diguanylate cyclase (GGDEF)-like protein